MASALSENHSLYFLHTIARALESARSTNIFLDENIPPSEILSLSDRFLKVLRTVDGSLSVMKTTRQQMEEDYKQNLTRYRALRNTYMDRINARKASEVQMNTTAEVYDENQLFQEVIFKDGFCFPEFVELAKPEEYSVLSITEKMKNGEPEKLAKIEEMNKCLFDKMDETIELCRNAIVNFRRLLSSPKFIQEMSTDIKTTECVSYIRLLQRSMLDIINRLESLRHTTTDVFQTYLAVEGNYKIYEKATNSLISVTLESAFNSRSVYEIL